MSSDKNEPDLQKYNQLINTLSRRTGKNKQEIATIFCNVAYTSASTLNLFADSVVHLLNYSKMDDFSNDVDNLMKLANAGFCGQKAGEMYRQYLICKNIIEK